MPSESDTSELLGQQFTVAILKKPLTLSHCSSTVALSAEAFVCDRLVWASA
jgi:hypothetical protein